MIETPLFQHDCDECVFLGSHSQHDLYFCEAGVSKTVIARYGTEGAYLSGLALADQVPLLGLALVRALSRGLLTWDDSCHYIPSAAGASC